MLSSVWLQSQNAIHSIMINSYVLPLNLKFPSFASKCPETFPRSHSVTFFLSLAFVLFGIRFRLT